MDPVTDNLWVFFGITILISFSGVMMPGPVFAAAVAKGYEDERAGIKIALGHGLIEFPLMAFIVLSMGYAFTNELVRMAIGLVGGVLLVFLGASMIKARRMAVEEGGKVFPYGPLTAGAVTTSVNPYFFLWWATVGAILVMTAQEFGAMVVVVFAGVHWTCDLAWYWFTSFAVFRTRHLWTPLVHEVVFGVCGVLMVAFGVYFVVGPASELL